MEKASHLRRELDDMRYRRRTLIIDIQEKRKTAEELKKKRDALNAEVKRLVTEGKAHLKHRDEFHGKIKGLKGERAKITKDIKPMANHIRSEKELRRQLNRTAKARSLEDLKLEFTAMLKTLFTMDLGPKEEVIMVEMVMDVGRRYGARKNADTLSTDIHKTWEDIKEIEKKATVVSSDIMGLASEGEKEHQAAMELFDKKREISDESQECHEGYIALRKEIKVLSREIDSLSRNSDAKFRELRPLENSLNNLRMTRWEQQRLDKLKTAKKKMETTGKLGLEDLRVLVESRALNLDNGGGKENDDDSGTPERRNRRDSRPRGKRRSGRDSRNPKRKDEGKTENRTTPQEKEKSGKD